VHLQACRGCGPTCRCCAAFLRLIERAHRSERGAPEGLRLRLRRALHPTLQMPREP
jgi:hypothetical protein